MIYKILIGILCTIVGGIALYNVNNTTSYEAQTSTSTAVVVEEVDETYPDDVLKEAQEAQNRVLKRFKTEQQIIDVDAKIEAQNALHKAKLLELENQKETLEKELSF